MSAILLARKIVAGLYGEYCDQTIDSIMTELRNVNDNSLVYLKKKIISELDRCHFAAVASNNLELAKRCTEMKKTFQGDDAN